MSIKIELSYIHLFLLSSWRFPTTFFLLFASSLSLLLGPIGATLNVVEKKLFYGISRLVTIQKEFLSLRDLLVTFIQITLIFFELDLLSDWFKIDSFIILVLLSTWIFILFVSTKTLGAIPPSASFNML